jgi:hydroxymethylbilane synthase
MIRIATRKSPLALWQAQYVQQQLQALYPELEVSLVPMSTTGDKWLKASLAKVGGKGLFTKELEKALLSQQADIAVHSMKDLPMQLPEGLGLAAICRRGDPYDAFVSSRYACVDDLPQAPRIGTSSLRRASQLRALRPDGVFLPLRGNVNSRLSKLDAGEYDAIILACAGLKRLQFDQRITQTLTPAQMLPAVGQGAIGIECCLDNQAVLDLLRPLADLETTQCVMAERAVNKTLQGSCQVPLAAHAWLENAQLHLQALVADPESSTILKAAGKGIPAQAEVLGQQVAESLLQQGAQSILAKYV